MPFPRRIGRCSIGAILLLLVSHALARDDSKQFRYGIGDHIYVHVVNDQSCPPELKRRDMSGQMRVFIRRDGTVKDMVIDRHFGDRRLDIAAVNVFKTWKFAKGAGRFDVVIIPVTFTVRR